MSVAPSTPRHKRLALAESHGHRASSTPPGNKLNPSLLAPHIVSPSSRHSSPGIERLQNGRHYADDVIPRRLTASPVARIKDRDRTRRRLTQFYSFDHAVELLKNAKNVVVLSGAGISTSLDIPDFRSDGGFYTRLSSSIGITTPEEFFSLDFFTHNSEAFWDNVKPLLPKHARTKAGGYQCVSEVDPTDSQTASRPRYSKAHALLALLQAQNQLLTNYTQNIDGLEFAAGVSADKVIQCHGSWDTATCLTCGKTISAKKYLPIVYQGNYPRCKCAGEDLTKKPTLTPKKRAKKRKRSIYEGDSDHDSDDGTAVPKGLFKPDITFFGEGIPGDFVDRLAGDKMKADLLLILGTSLKVRPVKTMLVDFPPHVPQIWVNRDRYSGTSSDMPGVHVDIELLGECDTVIEELCRRARLPLEDFAWNASALPSTTLKHETVAQSISIREKARPIKPPHPENKGAENVPNDSPDHLLRVNAEAADLDRNGEQSPTQQTQSLPAQIATISETTMHSRPMEPHAQKPAYDIRVVSDIDADWRWRISKRHAVAVAGNDIAKHK